MSKYRQFIRFDVAGMDTLAKVSWNSKLAIGMDYFAIAESSSSSSSKKDRGSSLAVTNSLKDRDRHGHDDRQFVDPSSFYFKAGILFENAEVYDRSILAYEKTSAIVRTLLADSFSQSKTNFLRQLQSIVVKEEFDMIKEAVGKGVKRVISEDIRRIVEHYDMAFDTIEYQRKLERTSSRATKNLIKSRLQAIDMLFQKEFERQRMIGLVCNLRLFRIYLDKNQPIKAYEACCTAIVLTSIEDVPLMETINVMELCHRLLKIFSVRLINTSLSNDNYSEYL